VIKHSLLTDSGWKRHFLKCAIVTNEKCHHWKENEPFVAQLCTLLPVVKAPNTNHSILEVAGKKTESAFSRVQIFWARHTEIQSLKLNSGPPLPLPPRPVFLRFFSPQHRVLPATVAYLALLQEPRHHSTWHREANTPHCQSFRIHGRC
jgi:hypothetical protein